jgi:hypothetical protein
MNYSGDSPGGLTATGLLLFSGVASVRGLDAQHSVPREEGAGPQLARI